VATGHRSVISSTHSIPHSLQISSGALQIASVAPSDSGGMVGSVNRLFKAFSLLVIAAASAFAFTNHANAQKPIIYPDGHFPLGKYYTAADLARLSVRAFSASPPSYLTGTFEYLGVIKGEPTFSPVSKIPWAFSLKNQAPPSKTALRIHFFDNSPRNLAVGKAIAPNTRSPLTLKRISRTKDGFLIVETEYWGTP
jgi:hypothetical protein